MKRLIAVLLIFLLSCPIVFADILTGDPTITVIYSGDTTIKTTLATKFTDYVRAAYLSSVTDTKMKPMKFPYFISDDKLTSEKTVIAVNGYRCNNSTPPKNEPANLCGYWISATKNKNLVATNSPIWISPPPYQYVVSEVKDTVKNTITVTIAENPQMAFEQTLIQYVRDRSLGSAIIGTKL
jgi:hypothetical protein